LLCFLPISYPDAMEDLGRTVQRQTPLILLLISYMLMSAPITVLSRIRTSQFGGLHYAVLDISYTLSFLLPFLLQIQLPFNIVCWTAYLGSILFSIFVQSRASVMVLLFVNTSLFIWFLIATSHINHSIRRFIFSLLSLLLVIIIILPILPTNRISEFVDMSWEGLMFRMTNRESSVSFTSNDIIGFYDSQIGGRGSEMSSVFSQATLKTWLIGEGFGSFWFSNFWQTWFSFVHNGQTNLLMKGGIIYPFLFMFIVLRALIGNIRNIKNPYLFACYIIVLDRLILFSIHAGFYPGYSSCVFWICLGYLLMSRKDAAYERSQNFTSNETSMTPKQL